MRVGESLTRGGLSGYPELITGWGRRECTVKENMETRIESTGNVDKKWGTDGAVKIRMQVACGAFISPGS